MYLLSSILNSEGAPLADIAYAAPAGLTGCPSTTPSMDGGVIPYVSRISLAGGHVLDFNYSQAVDCYLSSISYRPSSGAAATELVSYVVNPGAGKILEARFRGGDAGVETYTYADGGFAVHRGGMPRFVHTVSDGGYDGGIIVDRLDSLGNTVSPHVVSYYSSGNVKSSSASFEDWPVSGLLLTQSGRACLNPDWNSDAEQTRLVTATLGGSGNSSNTPATLNTYYQTAALESVTHRRLMTRLYESCGGGLGCSEGELRWERRVAGMSEGGPVCPSSSFENSVAAQRDKRGNWLWTPKVALPLVFPDGGMAPSGLAYSLEVSAVRRGVEATGPSGGVLSNALETTNYSYMNLPEARHGVQTVTRPSVLNPDGGVTKTTFIYEPGTTRMVSEVTTGMTKADLSNWAMVERYRGTFYRRIAADPFARLAAIEGPCWLDSETATTCSTTLNPTTTVPPSGAWPLTEFEYHGATNDTNAQRLFRIKRYPNGSASTPLLTELSAYTPEGDPGRILDVSANVETLLKYSGRRPVEQTVRPNGTTGGTTTRWVYDDDQLHATQFPEGNWEVTCHRADAFPNCSPNYALKTQVQWRAKVASYSGSGAATGWTEAIVYAYSASGELVQEQRLLPGHSSARLIRNYSPDLHGRVTVTTSGPVGVSGSSYSDKAHFDGANNQDAIGPAHNLPPDYCFAAGSESPLCWWFRHDRANRLNRATAPNNLARSCFDFDAVGNTKRITFGEASGANGLTCDEALNKRDSTQTPSTATSTSLTYAWDDFGNIIEFTNTGADSIGAEPTRYVHDARGNVVQKRTPPMFTIFYLRLQYDGLNRLVRVAREGTGSAQLYLLEYDQATVAPAWLPARTYVAGRLARRYDSYGDTWYSYDALGRVIAEYREKTACDFAQKGSHCRPHSFYSWRPNGGPDTLTYPFGRQVRYDYNNGSDRPAGITVWIFGAPGASKKRQLIQSIAWEPYGGLRGYQLNKVQGSAAVEYFQGAGSEGPISECTATTPAGGPDGSGRVTELVVAQDVVYQPNETQPAGAGGTQLLRQSYRWAEDQLRAQQTCVASYSQPVKYTQDFEYDSLQRLTLESKANLPAKLATSPYESRTYDSRGNRVGGARDGYLVDKKFPATAPLDGMTRMCWEKDHFGQDACLIQYDYAHNPSGVLTSVSGNFAQWSLEFGYSHAQALSDVFASVTRQGYFPGGDGAQYSFEMYYDAFGRRRAKVDALGSGDGREFYYDTNNQLFVDQSWTSVASPTTLDEYVWLDGRPVIALRSNVDALGVHQADFFEQHDNGLQCSRPTDEGAVSCGTFFLVSNLQRMVVAAFDVDKLYFSSLSLSDADGNVNRSHLVESSGAALFQFPVPSTFVKQARFRSAWTGSAYGYGAVDYFSLNGVNVLSSSGWKIGRSWSAWSDTMSGNDLVEWAAHCASYPCESGSDALEWRVWQNGAPQFHTRLRFPGQYHDAESDLYENWNRYYDPSIGRYLSPEPLLQEPTWVASELQEGHQVPAYSYARNNPVAYIDPDGLDPLRPPSGPNSPPGNYHGPLPLPNFPSQTPPPGPQLPEYSPPPSPPGPGASGSVPGCTAACSASAAAVFALCMAQKQNLTLCRKVFYTSWTVCMAGCLKKPSPNACK